MKVQISKMPGVYKTKLSHTKISGPPTETAAASRVGRPLDIRVLDALSRVTSSGMFIPIIDGLRFIAISSVFLYHLCGYVEVKVSGVAAGELRMDSWLGSLLSRGWFGVNLFFVISGFIISLPFASHHLCAKARISLKNYYLRRVSRLEPPHIIRITVCFILLMVVKGQTFAELWSHFLATLFYSHNIVYGGRSTITAVAWTLEIEIQFYVIAPIIAAIFAISSTLLRRSVLVAMIAISAIAQPYLRPYETLSVLLYLHYVLTGFLLTDLYLAGQRRQRARSMGMDLLFAAAFVTLYCIVGNFEFVNWHPAGVLLACVGLLAFGCGAFGGRFTSQMLSNRWIVVVGGNVLHNLPLSRAHLFSNRTSHHPRACHGSVVGQLFDPGDIDGTRDAFSISCFICSIRKAVYAQRLGEAMLSVVLADSWNIKRTIWGDADTL